MSHPGLLRLLGTIVLVAACSGPTEVVQPDAPDLVRFPDCDGPATSLDPNIAITLLPRSPMMQPDNNWALLAETLPGGFAGVFYDKGKPVLMLTDPSQAPAAKAALLHALSGFDVAGAEVRQARWDFAQLVNWFDYLVRTPIWRTPGMTSGDKDEVLNRIRYGVVDAAARERLLEALASAELPCDLIVVEITGPIELRNG